jgi:O-antigen/teichoic acid export membrane protein
VNPPSFGIGQILLNLEQHGGVRRYNVTQLTFDGLIRQQGPSMLKQITGYMPANIIPAVTSFVMVYAYTRLLTPKSFGAYSFIFSAVMLAQTAVYYSLSISTLRFYPVAVLNGGVASLMKGVYSIFYAISVLVSFVWIAASILLAIPPDYLHAAWLAVPLLVLRSAVSLNQAVNRSANRTGRYNLIECANAVGSLIFGLAAIFLLAPTAGSVLLGFVVAAAICCAVDIRLMLSPFRTSNQKLDREALTPLVAYSIPLATTAIAASILQLSDRFLLGTLGNAEMLGIYAVAFSLVDRPISLICSSISTVTFPLAVHVLENQGQEAGRSQNAKNGTVLLGLLLPACVGLALTAPLIAAVLVGDQFRVGVARLIPIFCLMALCRGVRAHFVDHAFHLARRPDMMLWTYAPAALASILLNLIAIPRYGPYGAAFVGLVCQAGALAMGWAMGRSVFPIWLPPTSLLKSFAALLPMIAVLTIATFPPNLLGLICAVGLGGGLYLASALVLDVGQIRSALHSRYVVFRARGRA